MLNTKSIKFAIVADPDWKKFIDDDQFLQKKIKEDSLIMVRMTILKRKNVEYNNFEIML